MTNTGMTHTLVTFLGKGREDPRTGYRETTYRFPDGSQETTHFFGLALAGHLEPDRLVVLGTARSMWGALVEHVAAGGEEENARLALIDAEEAGTVDQLLLDRLSGVLRRAVGRDVMPRLIPFGATPEEQRDIPQTIAAVAGEGEVSFDLTHGFRHLGMVGMLSAFMLERIGRLKVRSLWYGALDMTARDTGITPVLQLDGLNAIQRWIGALDRFDASGDYGVFAPLLEADGVPRDKARCLEEAAFFERSFNLGDAARRLRTFAEVVRRPLPGASGLFQARLAERLAWIAEPDLAAQQLALAQQYLERADFVRRSIRLGGAGDRRVQGLRPLRPAGARGDAKGPRRQIQGERALYEAQISPQCAGPRHAARGRVRSLAVAIIRPPEGGARRGHAMPAALTASLPRTEMRGTPIMMSLPDTGPRE